MGSIIRKLLTKAIEKTSKLDASDTFIQMNIDDVVHVLKAIIF